MVKARVNLLLCCILTVVVLGFGICTFAAHSNASEWIDSFTVTTGYANGAWSSPHSFSFTLDDSVTYYTSATYGYDTWWVKEDYIKNVQGAPTGYSAKGRVTNSSGTSMETAYIAHLYSSGKADVKHTGVPVTFTGFLKDN